MKNSPEILENQWNRIGYTNGGFLQIDTDHPLEWHIGYQSLAQRTLLLISDTEIGAIASSKSMKVTKRRRESDNNWTLSFELLRKEQEAVFAILCCDLIEYSRSASTKTEALKLVTSRYKQWSILLETKNSGLMDEQKRKGLIGELLFLEKRINSANSILDTIQGWVGPDGADQDFFYSDGWFEIKTISVSAVSVTISSLEQLAPHDKGELVVQRIDKVPPGKSESFSLNDVVRRINSLLTGDTEALDLFRMKVCLYGYMDLQQYSEQKYCYFGTQHYLVNDSFPKLTKAKVPPQISALHYELDLPSLENWLKE